MPDPNRPKPGDTVEVVERGMWTLGFKDRPQRKIPVGVQGFVERSAMDGAILRINIYDAPDGKSDVFICHPSMVKKV
jgi:hypothetical protein